MYKILVVEDDQIISQLIEEKLEAWGYDTRGINDFNCVLQDFNDYKPNLVLLDIVLPFYNGYHWCQEIRKLSDVPIIFISSASDNMNIVMAMNMGGDDFVCKPFDMNVLVAKVQAILRRSYEIKKDVQVLEHKGILLNTNDATITYRDKKIELTKNDYKIIMILFENVGKIVKRDEIMQRLWETDEFIDDNTLTVNMTRLRRKLEDNGICDLIQTKKGIGYIIE